jgi:RNA polymerase sigma-70 factor, ECF subfamily
VLAMLQARTLYKMVKTDQTRLVRSSRMCTMRATSPVGQELPVSLESPRKTGLPNSDHETALLSQAQSGDKEAFVALLSGHLHSLHAIALRITRSYEQAEDTVQDAVLKAYIHLPQFQAQARFSTWISRIAVNEALTSLRKHKRAVLVPLGELGHAEELRARSGQWKQRQDDPESLCARQEVRESLIRAVGSLLPPYRAAFVLTQVKGCTIQEVAEQLQLTIPTVKTRVHRARKQLREELSRIPGLYC